MLFLEVWGFIDADQQAVTGQTPHSASEGAQTLIYGSWFLKGSCANANPATANRASPLLPVAPAELLGSVT